MTPGLNPFDAPELVPNHVSDTLTVDTMRITPFIAQTWLNRANTRNRSIKPTKLTEYTHDMELGRWTLNGETIKFSSTGVLLDGQHRLLAVVNADTTIDTLIVRGLPDEAQDTVDTGAARSASDQLKLGGYAQYTTLAAAAKIAHLFDTDRLSDVGPLKRRVTHSDIKTYVADHPALEECARIGNTMRVDMSAGVRTAGLYLCTRVDPTAASEFFGRLADGANLPTGNPIHTLRERLRQIKTDKTRVTGEAYLSLTIRAWNAWREGKTMHRIQTYRSGMGVEPGTPIPCPKPI